MLWISHLTIMESNIPLFLQNLRMQSMKRVLLLLYGQWTSRIRYAMRQTAVRTESARIIQTRS